MRDSQHDQQTWEERPLLSLVSSLESGSRPKGGVGSITEGVPSLGGEHLDSLGGFKLSNIRYVPQPYFDLMRRGHIRRGDVLIVKDGATTGKVSIVRDDFPYQHAVANEHLFVCRPRSVDPEYLFWFLYSSEGKRRILEHFKGSAQGGITRDFAEGTLIPLAPTIHEQERLSNLLRATFTRRLSADSHLHAARNRIERLRQVILDAATSGHLTLGWRQSNDSGNAQELLDRVLEQRRTVLGRKFSDELPTQLNELPEIPENWVWASPGALCDPERVITYGVIKLGAPVDDGVPTLRSSDVRWLRIDDVGIKRISREIADNYKRTYLRGGEVLVTVRGTLGGVAVAGSEMAGWNVSREVAVIPMSQEMDANYCMLAIGSMRSQRWLGGVAKGVAYTGVNIEDLRRLPLAVPPIAEQREIVRVASQLLTLADALTSRIDTASRRVDLSSHAVFAKAFRGELTTIATSGEE